MSRRRRQSKSRDLQQGVSLPRWTLLLVGQLGPEHIGRIVYTNHDKPEVAMQKRPAYAVGGTLVGYRQGPENAQQGAGARVLVIQQGAEGLRWTAPLNHPVLVQA